MASNSAIPLVSTQTRQPNSAVWGIERNNYFGARCVAAVAPSLRSEVVTKKQVVLQSGASFGPDPDGLGFQHVATSGGVDFGASGGLSTVVDVNTPMSVYMRLYVPSTAQQGIFDDSNSSGNTQSVRLQINASGKWEPGLSSAGTGTITATVGYHDILMVHHANATLELFVDGVSAGTDGQGYPRVAGVSLRLGCFGAFTTVGFTGRSSLLYIFAADVSANLAALRANPWQVFKAPQQTLRTGASAVIPFRQYGISYDTRLIPATAPTQVVYSA